MTWAGSNHDWPVRRSYSQPCHGQRRISPARLYWNSPTPADSRKPCVLPLHSGPPWCGQRLRTAKNSPLTLNTPIIRPATSTSLRSPGGISATVATTYFNASGCWYPRGKLVERPGVFGHQLLGEACRQLDLRQRLVGRVEVPVRVVGREHQSILKPRSLLQQLDEFSRPRRLLHRLGGQPEVLRKVLRRQSTKVRHFVAQLVPRSVQSPGQRRRPGEATFDQHDLQPGELLEHAFADQADHLGLERGGHASVVLEVHGWPARTRNGVAALAAEGD